MELTQAKTKKPPSPDPEDPALVLTFEDLTLIGKFCHKNLQTREQLIKAVSELSTIDVEGVLITLEPKLVSRLKTRCLDKGNFPSWLASVVVRQLHDYAGW